jgi:phospholipid/cholesterol/gamma-HCH transport system permease protein
MNEQVVKKPGMAVQTFTLIGRGAYAARDKFLDGLRYAGGMSILLGEIFCWVARSFYRPEVRFRWPSLFSQMVRVGVRSIPIIALGQMFIGIILVLQMAPTLKDYGQVDKVANVIGVAVFRELGPLITAVVLTGFAGASIAAELGAMVESEEIKALRAHGLNPISFLVIPRVIAATFMMVCLAVIADVVGVFGGFATSVWVLGIDPQIYFQNTLDSVVIKDFITGLVKAGIFGMLISMIACYLGLKVSGGAEGVGRATTQTVVFSIVSLIATDCLFTAIFFLFNL